MLSTVLASAGPITSATDVLAWVVIPLLVVAVVAGITITKRLTRHMARSEASMASIAASTNQMSKALTEVVERIEDSLSVYGYVHQHNGTHVKQRTGTNGVPRSGSGGAGSTGQADIKYT